MKKEPPELAIYQMEDGEIRLKEDQKGDTLWASQKQIAQIFEVDRSVATKHIRNIFSDKEFDKNSTCAFFAQVQKEGKRTVVRQVEFYNLDIILAVGYRTNSKVAIEFRKWATKTLKQHITKGFTVNAHQLEKNYQEFLQAVDDVKLLAKNNTLLNTDDTLALIQTFSQTWFSLESYDKQKFPQQGNFKKPLKIQQETLFSDIKKLKKELITKGEATEFFAQEREKEGLKGIWGNIFQTAFGQDAYQTIEEKAAHFLYFIIKNHPFIDGNKRTGAFSFLWFLHQAQFDFRKKITPETLTTLALLVAESNPKEKEKMIGLILLLLQ